MFHSNFKKTVLNNIERGLFADTTKKLARTFSNLILQNNQALGQFESGFHYEGKEYFSNIGSHAYWNELPKLHESLTSEMVTYITHMESNKQNQRVILNFVSYALNMCEEEGDLYLVFPNSLNRYFQDFTSTRPTSLEQEEVDDFKAETADALIALKQQNLLNLLMK